METLSGIQSTPARKEWSGGTPGLSSPYEKIVTENDRLRKDLKKVDLPVGVCVQIYTVLYCSCVLGMQIIFTSSLRKSCI